MKDSVNTIDQQLSDQHVESRDQDGGAGQRADGQRVEGLKIQGEECVRDEEGGLSKNVTRKKRRCRIECVGGCTLRVRMDSCMTVTVFPKTVAEGAHDMKAWNSS